MSQFLKNTAGQNVQFSACDLAGAAKTTGVSVWITKDNGTRTAAAGTLAHKGGGDWNYAPTQAETDATLMAVSWGGTDVVIGTLNIYTTTKLVSGLNDLAAGAKMDVVDAPSATGVGVIAAAAAALILITPANKLATGTGGKVSSVASVDLLETNAITAAAMSAAAVAKIEAALLNEGDGQALIDAIVQAIDAANLDALLPAAIRDAILNRVLAGNHDTPGTPGKILQAVTETRLAELDAANLPADIAALPLPGDATEAKQDALQAVLNDLTEDDAGTRRFTTNALEQAPTGSGGGGGGEVTSFALAALKQLAQTDTTLTEASAGSVAKLAQGAGALNQDQQDQLDAIEAKTALITNGKVNILSPTIDGGKTLVLVRGDSYTATSPRGVLAWEPADDSDWPNLTGAEGVLTARNADGEIVIEQAVVIVNPIGPGKKITAALSAAATVNLPASLKPNDHKFDVQITLTSGDVWTPIRGGDNLRSGGLTIVEDQTRPVAGDDSE